MTASDQRTPLGGTLSPIKTTKDFKNTPTGWYKRWDSEMVAANKRVNKWHKQGDKIQARYQDRRGMQGSRGYSDDNRGAGGSLFRVNLFNSNINTLRSMLYGSTPKVDVSRRFADADDDAARVGSLILNRLLNTSIEASGDDTKSTLQYTLDDRLLPGLGIARVRYDVEIETIEHAEIVGEDNIVQAEAYTEEKVVEESAPVDYVHWDDFRWGWARTWSEVPWIAFRSFLTKDQAIKRFGEEFAKQLKYQNKSIHDLVEKSLTSDEAADAWDRAEIWEIWDKTTKSVYWWSKGFERILDKKKDPLGLYGFWPTPEPMLANCVTNLLLPQPDFAIAQDLYNEIDELQTRIGIITTAVRVVGVYDEANDAIKRMLEEGFENDLIPAKNWAKFAEMGGMDGLVDWLPIGDIVAALEKLVAQRSDAMALLYEVTGMADIVRGASGPDRETASAAQGKKTFASIRVQHLQEDFARFASDLMRLKAEVICKHFEEKTIVEDSNIQRTADGQNQKLVQEAIALLKEPEEAAWRIEIRPETIAMVDYDKMRQERGEFIGSVATFMQSAAPLAELAPNSMPTLITMLKWAVAGFKGSQEIEGVLDRAIEEMMKAAKEEAANPQPEQPSEAEMAAKASAQEHKQDMELQATKHQQEVEKITTKARADIEELRNELENSLKVIKAELAAAIAGEDAQADAAMEQDDHSTENKIKVKRTSSASTDTKMGANGA
jgi:hypothetical protein